MLGIKGVVLESALKFLNNNNQKTLSWEFRLSNSNDSHTSQLQIISRYKVLSLFMKSFPSEDSRSWGYWYWRYFTSLSFSSMMWSYLYSTWWGFVRHCILYCTLGHWEVQHSSCHCCHKDKKKRNREKKITEEKINMDAFGLLKRHH